MLEQVVDEGGQQNNKESGQDRAWYVGCLDNSLTAAQLVVSLTAGPLLKLVGASSDEGSLRKALSVVFSIAGGVTVLINVVLVIAWALRARKHQRTRKVEP